MDECRRNLLIRVVENYLRHKSYKSESQIVMETVEKLIDVDIAEMWMLTQ